MSQYNNAVLTLTESATPDPYMFYANDKFFLVRCHENCLSCADIGKTFTAGKKIEIWSADSLPAFHGHAQKHVIW